jgi:hypothetical protein
MSLLQVGRLRVHVDLGENCNVQRDLEHAAQPELSWRVSQNEVGCLENVAACPHQNHHDA